MERFVVITPEKTGTHLLTRALTFITGKKVIHLWDRTADEAVIHSFLDRSEREGSYFHMHAFPEPHIIEILKRRNYKVIFLLRDPRDHLISVLFYIHERRWEYEQLRMDYPFGNLTFDEQIEEMITGWRYGICVPKEFIWRRVPWMLLVEPQSYTVYFEDLVGEKGGGTTFKQRAALRRLARFLCIPIAEESVEMIAECLFGWDGLGTFRKGQIGSWKLYFNEEHVALFKQHFGKELIELGYAADFNWTR